MSATNAIDQLSLTSEERAIVDRVFGSGKAHPWSDELVDDVMDWMDRAALNYLKARRDSTALEPFILEFKAVLDRIVLERFETLRSAERDVHEHPPYHTADRWPRAELSIVKTVVEWAFECSST
jgi:hypothetical protein